MSFASGSLVNTDELPEALLIVCRHIANGGGKAWLVGGCVRDLLLGIRPKDFDVEVYGLEPEHLEKMLAPLGKTESVGKHFGVVKLWLDGLEVDFAMPRTERKTVAGHRGFSVESNPWLTPEIAVLRRDFTINAMMFDPLGNTLLDFHGGQDDLNHKILRHVSPAFAEDPLRPLRAMQFAARFQLRLDRETSRLCHLLLAEAETNIETVQSILKSWSGNEDWTVASLRRSAMVKWQAMKLLPNAITDSLQTMGGYGYMEDYGMEKRLRDITVLKSMAGSPLYLKRLISGLDVNL